MVVIVVLKMLWRRRDDRGLLPGVLRAQQLLMLLLVCITVDPAHGAWMIVSSDGILTPESTGRAVGRQ